MGQRILPIVSGPSQCAPHVRWKGVHQPLNRAWLLPSHLTVRFDQQRLFILLLFGPRVQIMYGFLNDAE